MNNVRYMCFCRSSFLTLEDFHSHKLCCENLKNFHNKSAKLDSILMRTVPGVRTVKHNVGENLDFATEVNNSWTVILDSNEETPRPEKIATNLWGRRLPKRNKVPYLSRAVPLSTDHSYERCQCGAVFVTRLGKRQHQARFCTFSKNKLKKSQTNLTVIEATQGSQMPQLYTVKSEFVEDNKCMFMKQSDHVQADGVHFVIEMEEIGQILK